MDPIGLVGELFLQTRDVVAFRKFQQAFQFRIGKGLYCLFAKRVAIDEEKDSSESLMLQQAIH